MKKAENEVLKIQLKAHSFQEVAGMYGICGKTLKKWLLPFEKEIGRRNGYFYSPKQMKIILDKLGIPEIIPLN